MRVSSLTAMFPSRTCSIDVVSIFVQPSYGVDSDTTLQAVYSQSYSPGQGGLWRACEYGWYVVQLMILVQAGAVERRKLQALGQGAEFRIDNVQPF